MTKNYQNIIEKMDRIERIETALTAFNAKRALSDIDSNLQIKKKGNCTLLIDSNKPNSIYYNRIKGIGQRDLNLLDEILGFYESKGITPCFDMTPNQISSEVSKALMKRGYSYSDQLVFLEMDTEHVNNKHVDIKIVKVDENNIEEFLQLLSLSIEMEISPELAEKKSPYFYQQNFHNYIAYIDQNPAGMGSLFIEGEEGYIENDFTFPSYRGKGVQKALLNHRMQVSQNFGLKKVYTDVEFGTISHENMLKYGFNMVYINSFWVKN